jgi:HSP20 family molecular chaperone IbpA
MFENFKGFDDGFFGNFEKEVFGKANTLLSNGWNRFSEGLPKLTDRIKEIASLPLSYQTSVNISTEGFVENVDSYEASFYVPYADKRKFNVEVKDDETVIVTYEDVVKEENSYNKKTFYFKSKLPADADPSTVIAKMYDHNLVIKVKKANVDKQNTRNVVIE